MLAVLPRFGSSVEALWRGRVPLVSAFWDYGILGGLLLHALATALFLWAINENVPLAVKTLIWAAPIPYSAFVLIAVWRSAAAYPGPAWRATAARWVILAWTALTCAL